MIWRWLSEAGVRAVHSALIAGHGGVTGVRDAGLLASALARVHNLAAYNDPDAAALAAAHAYGIASNHPFVDGNKRTAFVTAAVFLELNGFTVLAREADVVVTFMALAAGKLDEAELATWFRDTVVARQAGSP